MFCDVPSSDSDKECTDKKEKEWKIAKNLYKEMDTPTPIDNEQIAKNSK